MTTVPPASGRPVGLTGPTPELRRRLQTEPVVWCATLRPDGSAHLTPVWFVHDDRSWWIGTARRSVKVRNVSCDDRVSLALPDGGAPVVAEGRARIVWSDFPAAVTAAFADKYDGWDVAASVPDGPRVLLEIVTERWLMTGAGG